MIALSNFEQYYKLSAGSATLSQLKVTEKGIEGWAADNKKSVETKMDDDVVEASLLMRREGQASKLLKEEEAALNSPSSGSNPSN